MGKVNDRIDQRVAQMNQIFDDMPTEESINRPKSSKSPMSRKSSALIHMVTNKMRHPSQPNLVKQESIDEQKIQQNSALVVSSEDDDIEL